MCCHSACLLAPPAGQDSTTEAGLHGGAIAGIVIGCLVVVGIVVFFIAHNERKKKRRAQAAQSIATPATATTQAVSACLGIDSSDCSHRGNNLLTDNLYQEC